MAVIKLTKSRVDEIQFTQQGQKLYTDSDLKGFGLLVSKTAKSFIAQKDVCGKTRRINIGRYGTWTVELARKEAQRLLMQMDMGTDPKAVQREVLAKQVTLREAFTVHLERIRRLERADGTIESYEYHRDAMFKDWLNRPIQSILRSEVRERHTKLCDKHGPYSGNKSMKHLRAVFNTMMKEHDDIQSNPTIAVNWCKEHRRQEPVPAAKLGEWLTKVNTIGNPVRRDLQMFTLFTGLRRRDAATVRWSDLDLEKGSLHRPKPKGGTDRAFTIPLSDACLEILKRRKEGNEPFFGKACPWVFPTHANDGSVIHVVMPLEKKKGLPTPHRLRDTYTTAANAAGLSPYDIDVLTNHRPPQGAVTAGYIRQDFEHLQMQQQKVTNYLKEKLGIKDEKVGATARI